MRMVFSRANGYVAGCSEFTLRIVGLFWWVLNISTAAMCFNILYII